MTRSGMLDNWVRSLKPPFIMGSEVAGVVVGIGKNVVDVNVSIIPCSQLSKKIQVLIFVL